MKKFISIAIAVAGLLVAVSCQQPNSASNANVEARASWFVVPAPSNPVYYADPAGGPFYVAQWGAVAVSGVTYEVQFADNTSVTYASNVTSITTQKVPKIVMAKLPSSQPGIGVFVLQAPSPSPTVSPTPATPANPTYTVSGGIYSCSWNAVSGVTTYVITSRTGQSVAVNGTSKVVNFAPDRLIAGSNSYFFVQK